MAAKHAAQAISLSDNVSRVDLQVTMVDPDTTNDWATCALGEAGNDLRVKSGMTKTSIIYSTPRGVTAYIGSRASDRFYRVYDKSAESRGAYPDRSWRWEIEYKKERAYRVAMHLLAFSFRPDAVREIVQGAFIDYGVHLPTHPLPLNWRDKGIREETDDQKRLVWLTNQVRPTVDRLQESMPRVVVLAALGLDDLADTRTGEIYGVDPEWARRHDPATVDLLRDGLLTE